MKIWQSNEMECKTTKRVESKEGQQFDKQEITNYQDTGPKKTSYIPVIFKMLN